MFHSKRKVLHNEYEEKEEEDEDVHAEEGAVIDDLQFASLYATPTIATPTSSIAILINPPSNHHLPLYQIDRTATATLAEGKDEEEDDDESDVDLTQALHEMEDNDDEEEEDFKITSSTSSFVANNHHKKSLSKSSLKNDNENHNNSSSSSSIAPFTHHEIDLFTCPILTLQRQFDFNLHVDVSDLPSYFNNTTTAASTNATISVSSMTLRLAGKIQHHLIADRTLVIESQSSRNQSHPNNNNNTLLLDVGTLLVLLVPENDQKFILMNQNNDNQNSEKNTQSHQQVEVDSLVLGGYPIQYQDKHVFLVPLGKILEVFGPVSHPLYALRLNQSQTNTSSSSNTSTTTNTRSPVKKLQAATEEEEGVTMQTTTQEELMISSNIKETELSIKDDNEKDTSTTMDDLSSKQSITISNIDPKNSDPTLSSSSTSVPVVPKNNKHNTSTDYKDLWNEKGLLALWLQSHPNTEVYYFHEQAKIVDTKLVVQNSKKGCDASNVFDEEVVNANEIDYSDDEAEIAARKASSRKGGNRSNYNHRGTKELEEVTKSTSTNSSSISHSRNIKTKSNYTSSRSTYFQGQTNNNTRPTSSSTQSSYMMPTQPTAPYWNYASMPPPPAPAMLGHLPMPPNMNNLPYPPYPPPHPTYAPLPQSDPYNRQQLPPPMPPTYSMHTQNFSYPPPPLSQYWPGTPPNVLPYPPPNMNNPTGSYASYPSQVPHSQYGFQVTTNPHQYHYTNTTTTNNTPSVVNPSTATQNQSQGNQTFSGDTVYYHY